MRVFVCYCSFSFSPLEIVLFAEMVANHEVRFWEAKRKSLGSVTIGDF